ncbi:MAG: TonB-dependent receptor [Pseudomonadota bacterium]
MSKSLLFAAAAVIALPGIALAQTAETAQPAAAAPGSETQGVISYPAAFFAEANLNTAADMVTRLPGFVLDEGSGVRGFAGAAGNVLIDGDRPTTKTDDLVSLLRRIPAGQVERIDVIRGGAPGIDMQGKTVLANVVRKSEAAVTGLVSVVNSFVYDGRNAPGIRLEATRRGDGKALEGSLVASGFIDDGAGDGQIVQRDATGALIDRADMDTEGDGEQIVGTAAYETPLAGGKFRINGRLFFERYYYAEQDDFDLAPDARDRELNEQLQGEVGLRYSRDLGPRTKLETLFLQQWEDEDFDLKFVSGADTELFSNSQSLGETIGRTSVNFRKSDTLSFEVGGEGAFNWLESETSYVVNGGPVVLPAANVRVEEKRGELFGTATWKPWATLSLETGLRYEFSQIMSEGDVTLEKSLQFAKPRAVATWSPNAANQLRFRVEREVDQLDFDDFVASSEIANGGAVTSGNPDLNPQQAWVVEAAYERRFWTSGAVTLTLRHYELTDVIDRAPVVVPSTCPLLPSGQPDLNSLACSRFDQPANIGDGSQDQAQLDVTLPLDRIGIKGGTLRGTSIWRNSDVVDPTTGDSRRISGERPLEWEAHFTQDLPAYKLTWGIDVFGNWEERYYRYNTVQTVKLRTFVVPYIEYKPRKDLMFLAQFQNFTERDLVRVQDSWAGPRDVSPLQVRERRQYENGMTIYLRVRKTFG